MKMFLSIVMDVIIDNLTKCHRRDVNAISFRLKNIHDNDKRMEDLVSQT